MDKNLLNAALAAVALLFAVGGCTSENADGAVAAVDLEPLSTQADHRPAPETDMAPGNGQLPDGFPGDFPMPPNLVITDGQFTEGSHGVQANFLVRGTSAKSVIQVWGFFNDRLPEAGYEIQQFQPLDAGATQALVYFNGDRFKDCSVQLASTSGGTSVLINLPLKD